MIARVMLEDNKYFTYLEKDEIRGDTIDLFIVRSSTCLSLKHSKSAVLTTVVVLTEAVLSHNLYACSTYNNTP